MKVLATRSFDSMGPVSGRPPVLSVTRRVSSFYRQPVADDLQSVLQVGQLQASFTYLSPVVRYTCFQEVTGIQKLKSDGGRPESLEVETKRGVANS